MIPKGDLPCTGDLHPTGDELHHHRGEPIPGDGVRSGDRLETGRTARIGWVSVIRGQKTGGIPIKTGPFSMSETKKDLLFWTTGPPAAWSACCDGRQVLCFLQTLCQCMLCDVKGAKSTICTCISILISWPATNSSFQAPEDARRRTPGHVCHRRVRWVIRTNHSHF